MVAGTSAAGPGRQRRLMRERLGAAAAPAPHAAGSGPGRRLVGPLAPAAFVCAERAPLAAASWVRGAPWEPWLPLLLTRGARVQRAARWGRRDRPQLVSPGLRGCAWVLRPPAARCLMRGPRTVRCAPRSRCRWPRLGSERRSQQRAWKRDAQAEAPLAASQCAARALPLAPRATRSRAAPSGGAPLQCF